MKERGKNKKQEIQLELGFLLLFVGVVVAVYHDAWDASLLKPVSSSRSYLPKAKFSRYS